MTTLRWAVLSACCGLVTGALAQQPAPAPPPAPASPSLDARTQCLKACAGDPKGAKGAALLACLSRCEGPADAGSH